MIYAIKKQNESNERLISRFKKLTQRSRILMETKRGRFHANKPSKKFTREAAVKRSFFRDKRKKEQYYS